MGSKHFKETEYNRVKEIQKAGVNASLAAKITGRSTSLTSRAYKSNTYADYKEAVKPKKKPVILLSPNEIPKPLRSVEHWEDDVIEVHDLYILQISTCKGVIYGLGNDNKVYYWHRKQQEWKVEA